MFLKITFYAKSVTFQPMLCSQKIHKVNTKYTISFSEVVVESPKIIKFQYNPPQRFWNYKTHEFSVDWVNDVTSSIWILWLQCKIWTTPKNEILKIEKYFWKEKRRKYFVRCLAQILYSTYPKFFIVRTLCYAVQYIQ